MKDKNLKFKILAVLALIGIAVFLYLQIFGIIDPFGIMPTPAPTYTPFPMSTATQAPTFALTVLPTSDATPTPTPTPTNTATPTFTPTPSFTPTPTPTPAVVNITSVGDILMHASIWRYYEGFFENFTEDLEWGDLNCLNQETILVDESLGISGYPTFGSPFYLGDKELECGFNVICTATNHMMDKGIAGIQSTLGYWAGKDAVVLGVHADENEPHYAITEVNGVTFALFNYTYGTNGIEVPEEYKFMADVEKNFEISRKKEDDVDEPMDEYTARIKDRMKNSRILSDIRELNDQVDVVIVFPHWGKEYRYTPTVSQTVVAELLTEAGADIIIGTHPHVIEPMEIIKADNGNECICYYSLGNFVHGQDKWERCLGAMAKIVVTKNWDSIEIDAAAEPNVCHQYKSSSKNPNFYPFRLSDYTDEMAKKHRLYDDGEGLTIENLSDLWDQVFGAARPEYSISIGMQ